RQRPEEAPLLSFQPQPAPGAPVPDPQPLDEQVSLATPRAPLGQPSQEGPDGRRLVLPAARTPGSSGRIGSKVTFGFEHLVRTHRVGQRRRLSSFTGTDPNCTPGACGARGAPVALPPCRLRSGGGSRSRTSSLWLAARPWGF